LVLWFGVRNRRITVVGGIVWGGAILSDLVLSPSFVCWQYHFVFVSEQILSVVRQFFPLFGRVLFSWSQAVALGLPNNTFTGRAL
jgi:hypothetical protein